MSASGKSSNRRSEYARGYHGGGHGIYAAEGARDAARARARRQVSPSPVKVAPPDYDTCVPPSQKSEVSRDAKLTWADVSAMWAEESRRWASRTITPVEPETPAQTLTWAEAFAPLKKNFRTSVKRSVPSVVKAIAVEARRQGKY